MSMNNTWKILANLICNEDEDTFWQTLKKMEDIREEKEIPILIDENDEVDTDNLTNKNSPIGSTYRTPQRHSSSNNFSFMKENKLKAENKTKHKIKAYKKKRLTGNITSLKTISSLRASIINKRTTINTFQHKFSLLQSLREIKNSERSNFEPSKVSEKGSISEKGDSSSRIIHLSKIRPKSAIKSSMLNQGCLKPQAKPDIDKFIKDSSSLLKHRNSLCLTPLSISINSSVPILKIQKRRPKSVCVKDNSCQEFHKSSQQDEKYISEGQILSKNLFLKLNKQNNNSSNEKGKLTKNIQEKFLNVNLNQKFGVFKPNRRYKAKDFKAFQPQASSTLSVADLYERSKFNLMNMGTGSIKGKRNSAHSNFLCNGNANLPYYIKDTTKKKLRAFKLNLNKNRIMKVKI